MKDEKGRSPLDWVRACGQIESIRISMTKYVLVTLAMTTMREKLIKIGAKVVRHSKYVRFQLAEVAVPRKLFAAILERIQRLRAVPYMAPL